MLSIFTKSQAVRATRDDKGAVAVEYALIIGVIAVALVAALLLFGDKLETFVNEFSLTSVGVRDEV